ncbi:MAG: hypothetical protein Q8M92_05735, partial [Candidatus Subteraquimicrobiales bacterium]|nr:hypothetical protein [Candidatus Subteraquimicrobiales bacterium]
MHISPLLGRANSRPQKNRVPDFRLQRVTGEPGTETRNDIPRIVSQMNAPGTSKHATVPIAAGH